MSSGPPDSTSPGVTPRPTAVVATPRRPRHDRVNPNRLESQASPDQSPISFQIPIGFPSLRSIMPDLASVLHAARSQFCCTPRTPRLLLDSINEPSSRRFLFSIRHDHRECCGPRRAVVWWGAPFDQGGLRCLLTGAPAPPVHAHFAADLRWRGGTLRTLVETAAAPAPPLAARRDGGD